jgi:DNA polymerase delta subunit 1
MASGPNPPKRVLADSTNAHRNAQNIAAPDSKRRKLDDTLSPTTRGRRAANKNAFKLGSSQPKSHFEQEVLEKLSQDISGGKANTAEKDQQWDRPPLHRLDPAAESLVFQQIETEEGTFHGGRATVKLFGVTEVRPHI